MTDLTSELPQYFGPDKEKKNSYPGSTESLRINKQIVWRNHDTLFEND